MTPWHDQLRRASDQEARDAQAERGRLLHALTGSARFSFLRNLIHLGPLSPGCRLCGEGAWSNFFSSHRCNADCFFCARDMTSRPNDSPLADDIPVECSGAYMDYLAEFGLRGLSFSGGEPLLVKELVLETMRLARERFGSDFYIWVNTNGQLINEKIVRELVEAGLNELRFNIAARDYDLAPVMTAARLVERVTVEIPAIPEDAGRLRRILPRLDEIGVRQLNLHQMFSTPNNAAALTDRGYRFLAEPWFPVLSSENCALAIMETVSRRGMSLAVNYCSTRFKIQFQERLKRRKAAELSLREGEEITELGYLRRLILSGEPRKVRGLAARLNGAAPPQPVPGRDGIVESIAVPAAEWRRYPGEELDLRLEYDDPRTRITGSAPTRFEVDRLPVLRRSGLSVSLREAVARVILEEDPAEEVLADFFRDYRVEEAGGKDAFSDEMSCLQSVLRLERLRPGFPAGV